jgi:hypothetical protein
MILSAIDRKLSLKETGDRKLSLKETGEFSYLMCDLFSLFVSDFIIFHVVFILIVELII